MLMRVQRSAEHRVVPWANGLGITADVCVWPPAAPLWTWRLSIADVSDDVPFSLMPGIDRHIMVAQGEGMELTIAGAAPVRMDRTSPPLSFDGDDVTTCRLLDGPIADLNLMVRRGLAVGALRVVRVAAGGVVTFAPDDVGAVVLDGSLTDWSSDEIGVFDAVLRDGPAMLDPLTALASAVVAIAAVALV